MPRARGRLAVAGGQRGVAAAALQRSWEQCMRAGAAETRLRWVRRWQRGRGGAVSRGCGEGRGRGCPAAAAPLFRGVRTKERRGRAGRGGCRRCPWCWRRRPAARLGPEGRASPGGAGAEGKRDRAGRGCGKGCEAARPCPPCPCPDWVHGSVTQSIPPRKSVSGPGCSSRSGSRSLGGCVPLPAALRSRPSPGGARHLGRPVLRCPLPTGGTAGKIRDALKDQIRQTDPVAIITRAITLAVLSARGCSPCLLSSCAQLRAVITVLLFCQR